MDCTYLSKFKPSDFRHYANRAKIYAFDKEYSILHNVAEKISHNKVLNEKDRESLRKALHKIANIPKLATTCINQDCQRCGKLVDLLGEELTSKPWKLNIELYRWQKKCIHAWEKQGGVGIVKVITGAGKTVIAISLIEKLNHLYKGEGLKVVIVVPTTALLDQWREELVDNLNVPETEIGIYYGEQKDDVGKHKIILYVLNSARKNLTDVSEKIEDDIFLIVDECHRAGSPKNSQIFDGNFDYTLGLSATPERRADYAFEEILTTHLGKVIYNYSYSEARRDEIIPAYRLKRVAVPLTEREQQLYAKYTDKLKRIARQMLSRYPELRGAKGDNFLKELGRLEAKHDDSLIGSYTIVANKRKSVIHESNSKIAALKFLIKNKIDPRSRILIFHERTEFADRIDQYLKEHNINSTVYHTGLSAEKRRENLRAYRKGERNVLVTCRALDEGLDVPDTSVGIIVAATSSVRQWIQRIGRVLRKAPGKDYSEVYTIYVKDVEERIFTENDIENLEKSAEKIEKIEMELA